MQQTGRDLRLPALRRFAAAITILNILGHIVFGFEQSWAQPTVALASAYATELALEIVGARAAGRQARFIGGWRTFVDSLLSAHITGLAVAMLLYSSDQVGPIAFAAVAATGSNVLIRVPAAIGSRNVFTPSNFGISIALMAFPWVGIAPPYHFSENLPPAGQWILPTIVAISGSMLNIRMTTRLPLILAWVAGFSVQAVVRSAVFGTPLMGALLPMTGVAFSLYTFYMVTDPATTPTAGRDQIAFGAAVAAVYGVLVSVHIVFGLFFALTIVCCLRALKLYLQAVVSQTRGRVVVPAFAGWPARLGVPRP